MKTHKDMIRLPLAGLTLLYGIALFLSLNWENKEGALEALPNQFLGTVALTLLGYGVSIFVTGQLDDIAKARLIFLRIKSPLPGGEAFSKVMESDDRISAEEIRTKQGPLPEKRAEQNRLWYKMYKAVDKDLAVEDASKHYLLCRDACVLSLVLGFFLSISMLVLGDSNYSKATFIVGCIIAFFLIWNAARIAGYRLVKRVLILNPTVEASPKSRIIRP